MTRLIRWQMLLIIIGVVLAGLLLTYLAVNYTTTLSPGPGGTYVEGIAGFPRTLNPLLGGSESVERDVCALVFDGLTTLNERGEIEADLARRWEVSADTASTTYTFTIRSDAYWHDGRPVTSQDVIYTISLLQAPDFPGPSEYGSALWRTVAIEEVDDRTVRFNVPSHYAPFLDYTTVPLLPAHILSGTLAAALQDSPFSLNPVGTGPFAFERVDVEDGVITSVVLKQADQQRGARPNLDRIQFRFYAGYDQLLDAYEEGEVAGVSHIPPESMERAFSSPTLDLFSAPIARYSVVFVNMRRTDMRFFQEKEARQALLVGADRQRIIDDVLYGQAIFARGPLIAGTWAYKQDQPAYDYDPELADQILNDAGWVRQAVGDHTRRKEGTWFRFTLLTSSEPERLAVADHLAEDWTNLGISVTVKAVSPVEVRQALEDREFEAILVDLSLPGDPDPYPLWHETQIDNGQNYAGFAHRRMSEVIEQARTLVTGGKEQRRQLYYEFQDLFAEEVPALPLYSPVYTYGVDQRIHNVQITPLMQPEDRFRTIAEWWIVPRRVIVSAADAAGP